MGNTIRGNRAALISVLDEDGNWWEVNLKDNTATKINVLTKDDEDDIILNRLRQILNNK